MDVAFWGGIVPGNADAIAPLADAGVRGFKCFLTPSGVDEFPSVGEDDLRRALPVLARAAQGRLPLLVHAEDPRLLRDADGDPRSYTTFLATRPAAAEVAAIELIAALTAEYHVATHIVHVSSAAGLDVVSKARTRGLTVTAETCPHYLTFVADRIQDGATAFKCAPPIRGSGDRDALWQGLRSGVCRLVASDHSPAPPAMKAVGSGDFLAAWGGIASLEVSLAAVWTGASARGFLPADVARWMSEMPAGLAGLGATKGAIRSGCDADLVIWDPDMRWDVKGERLQQRHKLTPYDGMTLRGAVRATYLRGERIWDHRGLVASSRGHLL